MGVINPIVRILRNRPRIDRRAGFSPHGPFLRTRCGSAPAHRASHDRPNRYLDEFPSIDFHLLLHHNSNTTLTTTPQSISSRAPSSIGKTYPKPSLGWALPSDSKLSRAPTVPNSALFPFSSPESVVSRLSSKIGTVLSTRGSGSSL